jgi:hypothetical protein
MTNFKLEVLMWNDLAQDKKYWPAVMNMVNKPFRFHERVLSWLAVQYEILMNNSVVHRGATRYKVNYFKLQQQQYGYPGNGILHMKSVHVLTRTEKKFLHFIVNCMLPSWVLESVRSQ